jgi:hypothetical protein
MICHGKGDQRADWQDGGCCHIAGVTPPSGICQMRWAIDTNGDVYNSNRQNIGQLDDLIKTVYGVNNPNTRQEIANFLGWQTGIQLFVCTAFGQAAVDHWDEFMAPQGQEIVMTDRAQADVRWGEEFEVGGSAVAVGDAWAASNKPRNWCVVFGPPEGHCCWREDQTTNDANAAAVTTTRVSVSSQAQGAS